MIFSRLVFHGLPPLELLSLRKNGLTSLFKEVRVFKVSLLFWGGHMAMLPLGRGHRGTSKKFCAFLEPSQNPPQNAVLTYDPLRVHPNEEIGFEYPPSPSSMWTWSPIPPRARGYLSDTCAIPHEIKAPGGRFRFRAERNHDSHRRDRIWRDFLHWIFRYFLQILGGLVLLNCT